MGVIIENFYHPELFPLKIRYFKTYQNEVIFQTLIFIVIPVPLHQYSELRL